MKDININQRNIRTNKNNTHTHTHPHTHKQNKKLKKQKTQKKNKKKNNNKTEKKKTESYKRLIIIVYMNDFQNKEEKTNGKSICKWVKYSKCMQEKEGYYTSECLR